MHVILKVYTRMYKSMRDLSVICQAHEFSGSVSVLC